MADPVQFPRPINRDLAEKALTKLSQAMALYESEAEDKLEGELGGDLGGLLWAAELMLQAALGRSGPLGDRAVNTLLQDPNL